MLRIELVRVGNRLVGRTFSDRWNLIALTGSDSIPYTVNQSALKSLRRLNPDFTFRSVPRTLPVPATACECHVVPHAALECLAG